MATEPVLDIDLIERACGRGDVYAIVELCNVLITNLSYRCDQSKAKSNNTQLVSRGLYLADSLIFNFAYRMLKTCEEKGQLPPKQLITLIQRTLKQDRKPSHSDRRYMQWLEARRYIASNPTASIRKIAEVVDVAPSTISRWRADGKL